MVVLVLLLPLMAITVLNKPQMILRSSWLHWGLKTFLGPTLEFNWPHFNATVTAHQFLENTILLQFNDLCVVYPPYVRELCFAEARGQFRYDVQGFKIDVVALGPIELLKGQARISTASKSQDKNKKITKIPIPKIHLPNWTRETKIFPVHLEVDSLSVIHDGVTYVGALKAQTHNNTNHQITQITSTGHLSVTNQNQNASWDLAVQSPSHFLHNDWHMKGLVQADWGKPFNAQGKLDLQMETTEQMQFNVHLQWRQNEMNLTSQLSGTLAPERLTTRISGNVVNLHPKVSKIEFDQCTLDHQSSRGVIKGNRGKTVFNCYPITTLVPMRPPKQIDKFYNLPKKLGLKVDSSVNGFFIPNLEEPIEVRTQIAVDRHQQKYLATQVDADIRSKGSLQTPLNQWQHQTNVQFDLRVLEFDKLTADLEATDYAIPAPFNVLTGQVRMTGNGSLESFQGFNKIPFSLTTRLSSKVQKLDLNGQGTVSFLITNNELKEIETDLDLQLMNVRIQLPTLDIASFPRLVEDPRVESVAHQTQDKSAAKDKFSLPFRLTLKTSDKPLLLGSNLFVNDIPVLLDLQATPAAVTGAIRSQGAILELFRRRALIEQVNLQMMQPFAQSTIQGRLKIEYADYTVWIVLSGTLKKPLVRFESSPPMSNNDIISVLIYGEPLTQLEEGQVANVGGISSAISDRALAITSLYLLASTPIERVNYNPQSKVFSAKIKIAKGTSLIIGSDAADQSFIGLRRRLGKGWFVNTTLENDQKEDGPTGSAFIEWHKRY